MKPSRVFVILAGLPGLALAQVCTDIEDDAERLACYDATNEASSAVPEALAGQQVPPAPTETPVPEPDNNAGTTIAADAPEDFGRKEPLDAPREYIEASPRPLLDAHTKPPHPLR